MSDTVVFTREDEISTVQIKKPHVVLLGAGASKAALPQGDARGKLLPLMNDFINVLRLESILDKTKIPYKGRNFEDVYTEIYNMEGEKEICQELESVIYDYFADLHLPSEPTIYDYLILGLREKDIIATFNWDPFLVQAARRNSDFVSPPQILFLHGNVEVGYCLKDSMLGNKGALCSRCKKPLVSTKLLYPIKEKNYENDEMITKQWEMLRYAMKHTFQFTVFGYSAPKTDRSAIDLLQDGWGSADSRQMEETEIIDICSEDILTKVWEKFLYSHHYQIYNSFFDSSIAVHPRRTGEAYFSRCIEGKFFEGNPVPQGLGLSELQEWFSVLTEVEDNGEENSN